MTTAHSPQSTSPRLRLLCLVLVIGALALTLWIQHSRLSRLRFLRDLPGWSIGSPAPSRTSATGYDREVRQLIVPEPSIESMQWIMQTQAALAQGGVALNHVGYDNAPEGRPTRMPALYRAWLAALARGVALFGAESPGQAIECAAMFAEPVLQLLFWLLAALFIAWEFGILPATLFSLGVLLSFPLASLYLPGVPERFGAAEFCVAGVILPVLALARHACSRSTDNRRTGMPHRANPMRAPRVRIIALSVVALLSGTAGLCLSAPTLLPCLVGLFVGGVVLRFSSRTGAFDWRRLDCAMFLVLASAAALVIAFRNGLHVFAADLTSTRLTALDSGLDAPGLFAWLRRDGMSSRLLATVLPLGLLVPVSVRWFNSADPYLCRTIHLALWPVFIALGFACCHLRLWSTFDVLLFACVAVASSEMPFGPVAGRRTQARWLWLAATGLLFPGAYLLGSGVMNDAARQEFTPAEFRRMVMRDLGQWIALRDPKAVVLAPPEATMELAFHGGIRGLGTLDIDNRQGFNAAIRICGAGSFEEAQRLIQERGVTHIVIPSWDDFLAEYARLGSPGARRTFSGLLANWELAPWLRPVPYFLPAVPGVEATGIVIFEVVPEEDEPLRLARLTEYFIETHNPEAASAVARRLHRFPTDINALLALAQLERFAGDADAGEETVGAIMASLGTDAVAYLAPDRRAVLALVLARAGRREETAAALRQCADEMTLSDLNALTTRTLLRFLVLAKENGVELKNPAVQARASELIPPGSRHFIGADESQLRSKVSGFRSRLFFSREEAQNSQRGISLGDAAQRFLARERSGLLVWSYKPIPNRVVERPLRATSQTRKPLCAFCAFLRL
ncbi:MAG TPA: hypothetical protein VFT72_12360 [Opitutaceae bacterium]|nr:hypothetical protein [Opitutaceae bacterium]